MKAQSFDWAFCFSALVSALPAAFQYAFQEQDNAVGGFLMRTAASPNESGERTGGLNRAFKYLYSIWLVGKRLKS